MTKPSINSMFVERYEVQPNWRPLGQLILRRALGRQKNPLEASHDLDLATGRFVQRNLRYSEGLGPGRFSLYGAMSDINGKRDVGDYPAAQSGPISYFWKSVVCDLDQAMRVGDLKVWGRQGGMARSFIPIGYDTWQKACQYSIDFEVGPMDCSEWTAMVLEFDRLIGCDEVLLSLHAEAKFQSPTPPTKRGRPQKECWTEVEQFAIERLTYHGGFSDDDPKFNCQLHLQKEIMKQAPDRSWDITEKSLRSRLPAIHQKWLDQQSG